MDHDKGYWECVAMGNQTLQRNLSQMYDDRDPCYQCGKVNPHWQRECISETCPMRVVEHGG